ncbi:hypothetical protein DL96DRAFT_1457486, partial [Flagelloscypha sp. PMI_526]
NTMSYKWPERTSKHAPSFKKDALHSLQLFFEDLERFFKERDVEMAKSPTNAPAMTDAAKIEKTVEYLDGETRVEWREFEVYVDRAGKTWDQFKEAIYEEYPGSDPKRSRKFTLGDMHALIGKTTSNGIYTVDELGDFTRHYFAITKKLLDKKEIGKHEVLKGFINAFGSQEDVKRQYLQKNTNAHDTIPNSMLKTAAIKALEGPTAVEEAFQSPGRLGQTYPATSRAANRAAVEYPKRSGYDGEDQDPISDRPQERTVAIKEEPTETSLLLKFMEQMERSR